jgi:hypothetical protein
LVFPPYFLSVKKWIKLALCLLFSSGERCYIIFGEWKGVDNMKELIAKIRQRYNPSQLWYDHNPILDRGEMGIESDTGFFKFGDGVTEWRELRYALSRATVEVDKELETEGQAADAKATGERLEYLEAYVMKKRAV